MGAPGASATLPAIKRCELYAMSDDDTHDQTTDEELASAGLACPPTPKRVDSGALRASTHSDICPMRHSP
jgi:hypothetical protein